MTNDGDTRALVAQRTATALLTTMISDESAADNVGAIIRKLAPTNDELVDLAVVLAWHAVGGLLTITESRELARLRLEADAARREQKAAEQ